MVADERFRGSDCVYFSYLDEMYYSVIKKNKLDRFLTKDKKALKAEEIWNRDGCIIDRVILDFMDYSRSSYIYYHCCRKLETDTQFDLFYDLLKIIKTQKSRQKLNDEQVKKALDTAAKLSVMPTIPRSIQRLLKETEILCGSIPPCFNAAAALSIGIPVHPNEIAYGTDKLKKLWFDHQEYIASVFEVLNFMVLAAASDAYCRCEDEKILSAFELQFEGDMNLKESRMVFHYADNLFSAPSIKSIFQKYIKEHETEFDRRKLRTDNDITYRHFQMIYNYDKRK